MSSGGNHLSKNAHKNVRLAGLLNEAVRAELINDGLRPALDKLLAGFDDPQHPYRALLCALQVYLEATGIAGAKEVAQ